ncbi:MAG: TM2 domain-containing protein [Holophagaceae bacterium]|nr:TM2 domain-containing protein [Holophagaceae bacterium]
MNSEQSTTNAKSRLAAVLLAFFLGSLGIHNFFLGFWGRGLTQLICTIVGIPLSFIIIGIPLLSAVGLWVFIEFILLIASVIKVDASGRPLTWGGS